MHRWADALTLTRALAAPVIAIAITDGRLAAAALLLSGAWLSDMLDGRLARRSAVESNLGGMDAYADALVGVGVVVGLTAAGSLPLAVTWTVILVFGSGQFVFRNHAFGMVLQAVGYGTLLWRLWDEGQAALWIPLLTAGAIAWIDRRRLTEYVLPTFFRGIRLKT